VTDLPRGPFDHQPVEPGWWRASDGKWYPPESAAPTEAVPITSEWEETAVMPAVAAPKSKSLVARLGSWPLWAKIAAPVVLALLIAAIAGAAQESSGKQAVPLLVATTTTSVESTTTTATTTTTAPPTTTPQPTTTVPATPVVTAPITPPPTQPPATSPPTTQPPATSPPPPAGPSNPGDSKNCSDFANYADAKAWFDMYFPSYGDVAGLDADNDGIPCESLAGAP
jgi:hypothetical protein